MKYDFTTVMDRHNMDAIAVDGLSEDERPGVEGRSLTLFRCGWRI